MEKTEIEAEITNLLDQNVKKLIHGKVLNQGNQQFIWDGKNEYGQHVPPGIYNLRIMLDDKIIQRKLIYIKQLYR